MDEFARIAKYFAPLAGEAGLGLKDDAALLAPPPGCELVLTVDQMLEGVHFLSGDDPALIARKLLRRNLSDLAAMGAQPLGYLLTTALPAGATEDWLAGFAAGLAQDQDIFGLRLMGGDSSSSLHGIALSATLIGIVPIGQALRRNGARAGDEIWVTGSIGDAMQGLQARLGKGEAAPELITRSLLPQPRIGLELAGIVSAAIDVSDGLVQDLGHIARESGLHAVLDAQNVPGAPGDLEQRLTGGDDYELVLAVPPGNTQALLSACKAVPVTRIGLFQPGTGVEVRLNGEPLSLASSGWKHF